MCKKMFLFEKFDKNIQFNLRWCKAGDFFYLRTENSCPSEARSYLRCLL